MTKSEAIKIYKNSEFIVVCDDNVITFKVGKKSAGLTRLLKKAKSGLLITAWNPHSKKLSRRQNRAANLRLYRDLRKKTKAIYFAQGREYHDHFFEDSLVAAGVSFEDAFQLGAKFKQNAILYFERNKPVQLLWTAGHEPEIV
jgi:hypothetical protein